MKYLFIAEKSSLENEIKTVYNKIKSQLPYVADFDCFAGHIIRRAEPKEYTTTHPDWGEKWADIPLPMIPEQFMLLVSDSKIYKRLTDKIKQGNYDYIVNACDPDREGQAIFELFKKKAKINIPVKRFWTNDLTDKAITQALKDLKDNDRDKMLVNLKNTSILRGNFDWLVGMNFTIGYSLKMNGVARVGRVKTPTLALIVHREQEIKNFKQTTTYGIDHKYSQGFTATYVNAEGNVRFDEKTEAQSFLSNLNSTAIVKSIEEKKESKSAPALFKLSKLQTEVSKAYGYNADDTLAICQYLYEQKITSYPRTDCEFISSELTKDFNYMLRAVAGIGELKPYVDKITPADKDRVAKDSKYINDKKLADSGHSALVPTGNIPDVARLENNLATYNKEHKTRINNVQVKNVLMLMFKRFLGIFLKPQVSTVKEVMIDNNGYDFRAKGKKLIDAGWTAIYNAKNNDNIIPDLKQGDRLNVVENIITETTTQPPTRYTDGTLIATMENPAKYLTDDALKEIMKEKNGIGTPATRAQVIKELIGNKYIERKKGKAKSEFLIPTETGTSLINNLDGTDIVSVDMTGEWEEKLKQVEKGEVTYNGFETEMYDYIKNTISNIKNSSLTGLVGGSGSILGKCPNCGKEVVKGKYGAYCKNNCGMVFGKVMGLTVSDKCIQAFLEGKKVLFKGLLKKDGTGTYDAYLVPVGVKDYTYNDKQGKQFDFKMEFPKKRKTTKKK